MQRLGRARRALGFLIAWIPFLAKVARAAPDRRIDFSDFLAGHFRQRAGRPALIGEASSLTWGELDALANRVAHWAIGEGLSRGDVVGLMMENRPEYVAIWLGLSRVGIVTALLNTHLTGDRLAHCIREAGTRHLIVGHELAEAAASALPDLDPPPRVLLAGDAGETSGPGDVEDGFEEGLPAALASAGSFDEALASSSPGAVAETHRRDRRGDDGLFLIYTSGTTGLPKAANVSHSRALAAAMSSWKLTGLGPSDRIYCCLPLYHSAGGVMSIGGALLAGASFVVVRRFSAKRFWSDCTQHEVTAIQYIGELFRYLLNSPPHPDERSHRIRVALGNGLRPEVWGPFQERFGLGRIVEFYAATEGNLPLFNLEGRVGAVGHLPGFVRRALGVSIVRYDVESDTILRDQAGRCIPCPADEPGELVVKITKLTRFEGYTNEEASEKKILRDVFEPGDAYFRTGDLLRMDEDGFYYFVDRIGDTFRWKGENVATSEVGEVISVVAGVEEANVYGVEIPGFDGRAGMAAIVTKDEFDLEALDRAIEEGLASYARPLFLRLLPEMEITGTFKHRKVDLVKEGFDPQGVGDPILFRDPDQGRYVPLDQATYQRILAGEIRL